MVYARYRTMQGFSRALLAGWICGVGPLCDTAIGQAVTPPSSVAGQQAFYPLDQIHKGLRATAYTVFQGAEPEPMEVEILGVLKDSIGPGQDMILGQLHGAKAEYTGVVAGMSGSPVYADGKLIGALSYRIGQFSKDPICGITPIQQMLEVRNAAAVGPSANIATAQAEPNRADTSREVKPIATPLFFTGYSQATVDRFGEGFRAMGMEPVAGLAGGQNAAQTQAAASMTNTPPKGLVPGSAISAVLVRGDLQMSAACTVTYIDAHQLMACGHPLNQYGPVSMPMTETEVVTTLASPQNSFKIVNTGNTIGSFTEDRASAILGRFGEAAKMIPVTVNVNPVSGPPRTLHFEVLNNRQMTPQAVLVSVFQCLSGTNAAQTEVSYRLHGSVKIKGQATVQIDALETPTDFNTSAANAALLLNDRFSRVYGNEEQLPQIESVELTVDSLPGRQTETLVQAALNRSEASPGETLQLTVTLQPYQGPQRTMQIPIAVPISAQAGPLRLVVSDGATLDRLTGVGSAPTGGFIILSAAGAKRPESLEDTISGMNRVHANDRLFATWLDHAPQAVVDGAALASVPLSVANVFEPLRATSGVVMNSESVTEAVSTEVHAALTGQQVLTITVRGAVAVSR